ncbi:MAG: PD40 domain-containing protein [Chitinophagaceae bacterium]|nr:PD40 domain-containing protein [Chitinophagaceae bacterium]
MRTNRPSLRLLLLSCIFFGSITAQERVGIFEQHQDIGSPKLKGATVYDPQSQTYALSGAGANIWARADQFQFAFNKVKGDFIMRATVRFIGKGAFNHRKIGIMAREKLSTDSRYADACVHGDELSSLQYRAKDADTTGQVIISSYHPTEIELERVGNTFSFSAATFGQNYRTVTKEMDLAEELYVGLFICSHVEDVMEQAVFSNVQLIIPPAPGYTPYRDYIGSHLEIMDIETGHRRIVHSAPNSLQAPNWTPDGKYLIYSEEGLLKRFEIATGQITTLNTGTAKANNNDHVLSFDGQWIGISNHMGPKRVSTIFVLPVTGADMPTQITLDTAHSYLHSWSPDGKTLLYTAQRKGDWDIYSIDIASRKETRLTDGVTLDDGPEYSPDGRYIYFNSVRTGTMKIWRMKPDGTGQEQITFDEYNDWFPHFSRDGKWIVYLSFPKDMDPSTHPFYKKTYLRLIPAAGGVPKTIAYIFGGQGTINVPSWSPDGKMLAFISNSR